MSGWSLCGWLGRRDVDVGEVGLSLLIEVLWTEDGSLVVGNVSSLESIGFNSAVDVVDEYLASFSGP